MAFPEGTGDVRDQVTRIGASVVLLEPSYTVFQKAFVPEEKPSDEEEAVRRGERLFAGSRCGLAAEPFHEFHDLDGHGEHDRIGGGGSKAVDRLQGA